MYSNFPIPHFPPSLIYHILVHWISIQNKMNSLSTQKKIKNKRSGDAESIRKTMWHWDVRQNLQWRCRKGETFTWMKESRIQKRKKPREWERREWRTKKSGQIQCPDKTGLLVVSPYVYCNDLMISYREL